jgi:predicted RND superfamily exporter protein
VYSNPRADFGASFAAPMRSMLAATGVRSYLAGPSAIFHDMEVVSDDDLRHVELVTLPIAVLVLLVIFGSVVASLTPVLMAPVAVTLSLAVIYGVGHRIDMSIFVLNTTSMLDWAWPSTTPCLWSTASGRSLPWGETWKQPWGIP